MYSIRSARVSGKSDFEMSWRMQGLLLQYLRTRPRATRVCVMATAGRLVEQPQLPCLPVAEIDTDGGLSVVLKSARNTSISE